MKTGIIGLGAMGANMALNLDKNGYLHAVWNRTASKAEEIAEQTQAKVAASPAELARECDVIITCVSRDEDVLDVINSLAEGITPGTIVVDTSTVNAETARQAAEILREKDAHFLDSPVSGGVEGAKKGTLAMMAGGEEEILEKVRPVLSAIGDKISYIGDSGSGQACKAVNQIMAAGINQAVTEALAFGEFMGLNMDKVVDIVATGAAGNWFLDHRGKSMLADNYTPGFKLGLHHKDLSICKAMLANRTDVTLPIVEMTLIHYQRLMEAGYADEDISALFRLKRQQFRESGDM